MSRPDDYISRQAALNLAKDICVPTEDGSIYRHRCIDPDEIRELPSAQTEISRIEKELHGKTPEEQCEFLYWLLLKFGLAYTDSRLAVIEWLRGEKEDG